MKGQANMAFTSGFPFNTRKAAVSVFTGLALFVLLMVSGSLVETNNAGYYQVKQAVGSGDMSVRTEPGTYWQGLGTITTYKLSNEYTFSSGDLRIQVQFNDGTKAHISGMIKYRLSANPEKQLLLHSDFRSDEAVEHTLIRAIVTEAVKQTAFLMKAEESYSARRSEFAALAEEQVVNGIYDTVAKIQKTRDSDGNEFIESSVNLKLDANGKPVFRKLSPLPRYGIEVLQFTIGDIDYDQMIENLIAKKKEAEQQKVVARANAEKAKQDTITAREQGEARIAEAKANEEVKKIQAVVQAQQEYEVSVLNRKQADEDAKSTILKKQAEAEANRLLVKAGLTPLERANIDKETAIGVAKALADIQLPSTFIAGGGGAHGSVDPFTAIGLNQLLDISKKITRPTRRKAAPAAEAESEE